MTVMAGGFGVFLGLLIGAIMSRLYGEAPDGAICFFTVGSAASAVILMVLAA